MSKKANEEWYRRSFENLHLSDDFGARLEESLERNGKEKGMKTSIHSFSRAAAAAAACLVAFGSMGVCYAADAGGIRSAVELWFNGSKQVGELEEAEDGAYYRVTNEEGETVANFGGLTIDENGNETAMSGEELAGMMNNQANLAFGENGQLTFCYRNLSVDVTGLIGADGKLHIHVDDPQNPYNYFDFSEITGHGYELTTDKKPMPGVTYYEADASGLEEISTAVPEHSDDVCYGTYVTTTED